MGSDLAEHPVLSARHDAVRAREVPKQLVKQSADLVVGDGLRKVPGVLVDGMRIVLGLPEDADRERPRLVGKPKAAERNLNCGNLRLGYAAVGLRHLRKHGRRRRAEHGGAIPARSTQQPGLDRLLHAVAQRRAYDGPQGTAQDAPYPASDCNSFPAHDALDYTKSARLAQRPTVAAKQGAGRDTAALAHLAGPRAGAKPQADGKDVLALCALVGH